MDTGNKANTLSLPWRQKANAAFGIYYWRKKSPLVSYLAVLGWDFWRQFLTLSDLAFGVILRPICAWSGLLASLFDALGRDVHLPDMVHKNGTVRFRKRSWVGSQNVRLSNTRDKNRDKNGTQTLASWVKVLCCLKIIICAVFHKCCFPLQSIVMRQRSPAT